jgi:hypothetical protein
MSSLSAAASAGAEATAAAPSLEKRIQNKTLTMVRSVVPFAELTLGETYNIFGYTRLGQPERWQGILSDKENVDGTIDVDACVLLTPEGDLVPTTSMDYEEPTDKRFTKGIYAFYPATVTEPDADPDLRTPVVRRSLLTQLFPMMRERLKRVDFDNLHKDVWYKFVLNGDEQGKYYIGRFKKFGRNPSLETPMATIDIAIFHKNSISVFTEDSHPAAHNFITGNDPDSVAVEYKIPRGGARFYTTATTALVNFVMNAKGVPTPSPASIGVAAFAGAGKFRTRRCRKHSRKHSRKHRRH